MASKSLNIPLKKLRPYALIIELVHNASLVHDDVIDGSMTRRSNPTLHIQHSNRLAILMGDLFLIEAIKLSFKTKDHIVPLLKLTNTIKQMVDSELNTASKLTMKNITNCHLAKTAGLFAWSAYIAAYFSNKKDTTTYYKIGKNIGLIYQAIDDLRDYTSEKYNIVNLLGRTKTKEYIFKLISDTKKIIPSQNLVNLLLDYFKQKVTTQF